MRRVSGTKQRKELGIAHQVGNGKNAGRKYDSPVQRMYFPPDEDDDEDNNNSLYNSLIHLKDWGFKKSKDSKRKLNSYLKTWTKSGDINTLATIMEISVEDLKEHLEDFGSTDELPDHKGKFENLIGEFGRSMILTGLVPAQLISDLPYDSEEAMIREIFVRFNHYPFVYTGDSHYGEQGFLSKKGDCSTLLYMFVLALQAAGINITIEDCYGRQDGRMLVGARHIHGRNTTSNVDGIDFWCFNNHFWYERAGLHLDLLFMTDFDPGVSWVSNYVNYRGIGYYVFQNNYVMIDDMQCQRLIGFDINTLDGIGKGFATENEAQDFIDNHGPPG